MGFSRVGFVDFRAFVVRAAATRFVSSCLEHVESISFLLERLESAPLHERLGGFRAESCHVLHEIRVAGADSLEFVVFWMLRNVLQVPQSYKAELTVSIKP